MTLLTETLGLRAFEPHWRSPTFPANRPRRRLDWILISRELDFRGYGTLPIHLSDHLLVMADLVLL
jgi:endonuclease/exonuclease/phosphatase family metal-dependent hydrolase